MSMSVATAAPTRGRLCWVTRGTEPRVDVTITYTDGTVYPIRHVGAGFAAHLMTLVAGHERPDILDVTVDTRKDRS